MDILDVLVQKRILSQKQADDVRKDAIAAERKVEELLLEQNLIDEETLFRERGELIGMPLKRIEAEEVSLKALEYISEDSARYYKMVPLSLKGNQLEVGMVYPKDLKAQGALQFLSIFPMLCPS